MQRTAAAGTAGVRRQGVVFVHGVGDQRKSDTLLDYGKPLLDWLKAWYHARGEPEPRVSDVRLGFSPVDVGDGDTLSRGVVHLPGHTGPGGDRRPAEWVWAEAWWATSNRHPDFFTVLQWSGQYLGQMMRRLLRATAQRWYRLFPGSTLVDSTAPAFWARLVDLLNTMGMLVLYGAGAILGYPVVLVVMLLAQIPIPAVQDFVLLRVLRRFLAINAGEFRTLLTDELQTNNMCRRVADAVAWLVSPAGGHCDGVTIVAHSAGAVVSYVMLTDPGFAGPAGHVRKLITLGAGLNKAWDIAPAAPRLQRPLPGHIHWLDIWSSYDPVPAGWLEPPRVPRVAGGLGGGGWARIFAPDPEVVVAQRLQPRTDPDPYGGPGGTRPPPAKAGEANGSGHGSGGGPPVYWPVSEQVSNRMNVVTDHGGYWVNDEQVLLRLVAEVDAPYYRDSPFWRGDAVLAEGQARTAALSRAVTDLRERVSVLAAMRAAVVVGGLALVGRFLTGLWALSVAYDLPFLSVTYQDTSRWAAAGTLVRLAADVLAAVWTVATRIPIVGGLLTPLLMLPFWVLGPAVLALALVLLYLWVPVALWNSYDRRARARAVVAVARAR